MQDWHSNNRNSSLSKKYDHVYSKTYNNLYIPIDWNKKTVPVISHIKCVYMALYGNFILYNLIWPSMATYSIQK